MKIIVDKYSKSLFNLLKSILFWLFIATIIYIFGPIINFIFDVLIA